MNENKVDHDIISPQHLPSDLIVTDLSIAYGHHLVLEHLSLNLPKGQTLLISGASGSGKTSLLQAISGLLMPQNGKILWQGSDIWQMPARQREAFRLRKIGYIFQNFHLLDDLSPIENVLFPLTFCQYRISDQQKATAHKLLTELDVPFQGKLTHQLSRGEQQRTAIARSLMLDPPFLIADEPTASLDRENAIKIANLLSHLSKQQGKTICLVSHDDLFVPYADQHLILAQDGQWQLTDQFMQRAG